VLASVRNNPIRRTAIANGHIRAGDTGLGKAIRKMTIAAGRAGANQASNNAAVPISIASSNSFISMGWMRPAKISTAQVRRTIDILFKLRGSLPIVTYAVSRRNQHFVA
jgi:hypothetical protein